MLTMNKANSIAKSILGILLTVVLLTTTQTITAYAANNNPEGNSLVAFPALGVSSDTMDENSGTVNTLYSGGIIKGNRGRIISNSGGTVYENHGSIENISAGRVGTNYGTINRIENTGSLGENDEDGTVLFVGMGNEVFRNDGTIQNNYGTVSENYGTVSNNYGAVIMHDGQIVNNNKNGTVTFEAKISRNETIPAKGTIDHNKSHVKIYSGTVTIKENTGDIEITNATVTVEKNSGSITLGANAALSCSENTSDGVITKTDKSAGIVCSSNDGRIIDETAAWYKIVFVGDDGKAVIIECNLEKGGVYYTPAGSGVIFTLPPEYVCTSAKKLESGNVNTWGLNANPAEGDTEFTIICHKCSPGDYRRSVDKHWQECVECGRILNEGAHTCVCSSDYLYDGSTHWKICSVCNEKFSEEAHNFTDYKCVDCGYAKPTCIVTFDMNGHGVQEAQQTVVKGSKVVKPANPAAIGYTFKGWCADASVTTAFDFNAAITADTTIYAKWAKDSGSVSYTLTFNVGGGSAINGITGTFGKAIDLSKYIPTKEGYAFGGWYSDSALTSPVDEIKLTGNQNVYAKWLIHLPFTDVKETDWSYEDIAYVYEKGLMNGTSATTFSPKMDTSRAMIVTILYRLEGEPAFMNDNVFTDVERGSWYEKAVIWANGKGIVNGYGNGKFGPNDPITREQMAAILYRYCKYKGYDVSVDENTNFLSYTDFQYTSEYAMAPMMWAIDNGILQGSNYVLNPQGNATREQIAAILHRFCENIVK